MFVTPVFMYWYDFTGSGVPAGSFAIGMLSSGNIIVSSAPATASIPMARVNNVSTVVSMSSAHSVHPTVNSQYPAVIDGNYDYQY